MAGTKSSGIVQYGTSVRAERAVIGAFRTPSSNISLVNQQNQHEVRVTDKMVLLLSYLELIL
jgi:hypothetical protein